MIYFGQMRWDLKGMSFHDLWLAEGEEARQGIKTLENNLVQHLYKVAGEQNVIVIGDLPSAEEFDRVAMGRLPMHEHLIFDPVWSLEEAFAVDVQGYFEDRFEMQLKKPKFLYYLQMAWDPRSRELDDCWEAIMNSLKDFEECKILGAYRVAGQQRMIMIIDVTKVDHLNMIANLPVLKSPNIEKVWALREYRLFAEDVWKYYEV